MENAKNKTITADEKIEIKDLAEIWDELPEETRERLYYMILGVKFAGEVKENTKSA